MTLITHRNLPDSSRGASDLLCAGVPTLPPRRFLAKWLLSLTVPQNHLEIRTE